MTLSTDNTPGLIVPRAEQSHRIAILFSSGERQPENLSILLKPTEEKVIGRDPGPSGFVVYDSSVSRVHARIRYDKNKWRIKNESKRGTFINGSRARGWTILSDGAIIAMGGTIAEFSEDATLTDAAPLDGLIGGVAFKTRQFFQQARRAAALDETIFISGPTGTGKTACAKQIHDLSKRAGEPFVHVNLSALSPGTRESELFGHAAGAFTDAKANRLGLFRSAKRGTIFIDEIGELSPELQVKLLLAVDTRTVWPVGSDTAVPFEARIIVATHRDLEKAKSDGSFRADLYFRLATKLRVDVPALKDRRADIPAIAASILGTNHWLYGSALLNALTRRPWEGNVRELENYLVNSIKPLTQNTDPHILEQRLKPIAEYFSSAPAALDRSSLVALMERHQGNITYVAKAAGCSRKMIHNLLKKFKLKAADYLPSS